MSAFETIFRNYYRQLFYYALKFVENDDDAHNLVQDVFTQVYEKELYKKPESDLRPYLYSSVRNSALNFIKHRKVVSMHAVEAREMLKEMEREMLASGEKSLIEKETYEKIHQAIDELPDVQKEVVLLSRFEGLRNKEIAEKLDVPVRTVETRLFRALATLRQKLTKQAFFVLMFGRFPAVAP